MTSNRDNQVLSDGTFYWWQGQIVDDSTWQENQESKGYDKTEKSGWGHRYKIRIQGQHPALKSSLPDENLPTAEVLLPVTAGSGIQGSVQSPNLSQGDFVIGFFKDGLKRNEPIILGSYSTGSQTSLYPGDPDTGFVPRSGYKGKSGDKPVPRMHQLGNPGTPREGGESPNLIPAANLDKDTDDARETHLENNCEKKNSEVKGIQLTIKNLLKTVNQAKKAGQSLQGALGSYNLMSAPDFLTAELNKSTQLITQFVKNIMARVRGYVNIKINNAIKDVNALILPNQLSKLEIAAEKGNSTFFCVMEKVIKGLGGVIKGLLNDLINNFINAPLCAVENFLGNLIGQLMGQITSGISSALSAITGVIGSISGAVSGILNGVMNALNIASNVLSFFSCDTEQLCPDYDTWTWGSGAKSLPSPSAALGKKLDEFSKNIDIPGGESAPPCNTSGIPCGPPKLEFMGQSLSSASGNLIVSGAGAILGVDLTGTGSGYSSPPLAVVVDLCGIGQGAVLKTNFDPLLSGPPFTPITGGGTGGTPIYVGGTGGTPVTTPNGTPITAGGTGGTPVVLGGTGTGTGTGGGTGTGTGTGGGTGTETGTGGGTGTGTGTGGGTGAVTDGTPLVATNGTPITAGSTGGTPLYAGGEGGIPVTTSNGTSITAGASGGSPVTTITGEPIVVQTPLGGITSVEVIDPGFGYLPSPNGSVGGNGDIFANNNDGIYTAPNGNIDSYPPGTTISVTEGGTLGLPAGTTAEIYDNNGNLVQTIVGTGLLTPTIIDFGGQIYSLYESLTDLNEGNIPSQVPESWLLLPKDFEVLESFPSWDKGYSYSDGDVVKYNSTTSSGTVTIPETSNENITVISQSSSLSSGNTYPVILCLDEIAIDNSGYLYDPSDKIFITPSNGTELEVEYDQFGRVSKVNVLKKGCGFTDIPEIGIISLTGYNADLRPILRARRVGEGESIPEGTKVISVVDCVGKV